MTACFPHPQNCTGCNLTKITFQLISALSHKSSGFVVRSLFRLGAVFLNFPFSTSNSSLLLDQALGLLVSSSSIRYRTSTDDLSTSSSLRGLTSLRCGNSLLQVGFTLRCLQRLSLPHFASQLCHWHDNCCTSGASIPVLSY